MKVKFIISSIIIMCAVNVSLGQDLKNDFASIKAIDNQIEEEEYNTDQTIVIDRLIVKSPIKESDERFYSKKEWRKIKKQLHITNRAKTLGKNDTIYITIPQYPTKSSLSGW
ncbi:hypothetical protein [Aquimarina pacifica]|uniref:hypothetical protein n=1 Tax=Aquimarina pacifica TaxID=1296415 RepID=UPI0004708DF3|nr:hypothetical protein [Aquimarina pacifica]